MKEFNGLIFLGLVTAPELKTFRSNDGGTIEFYDLTLTDGNVVFNRVSGDSGFDFTKLQTGKKYMFAIQGRVKNVQAVANNGNHYNKAYNDFKVIGVPTNEDIKAYLQEHLK